MLFGIIKLVGILLFLYLTWRNLNDNYKDDKLVTYSWLAILGFLVGGRIVYGLVNWGVWNSHWYEWLWFWKKMGFSFWGGMGGMFLATAGYCNKNGWKLWSFLEDITGTIYLMSGFLIAAEVVKSSFDQKLIIFMVIAVLGYIISDLISKKYRSFVWYKSGKKGFVFFFTNLISGLFLTAVGVLYNEGILAIGAYLGLSLASILGILLLGRIKN